MEDVDALESERPNVWDVAGGIPLVLAAGGEVRCGDKGGWTTLERIEATTDPAGGEPDLRNWQLPLILGDAEAVRQMAEARQSSSR